MAVIELENITKDYEMGEMRLRVLHGIDLEIEPGDMVAIMGPSGSGKSTLMHIIGCLDVPTSGIYRLDGRRVDNLNDRELSKVRNQKIGFIFQAMNLLPQLTAVRNVELPLVYRGMSSAERREKAGRALEQVGLGHRLHHRPTEISGGEAQRVAIARSLVNDPDIILGDEPTGNLDSKTEKEIMKALTDINAAGKTMILVTHNRAVAEWCKRILHIRDGQIEREEMLEAVAAH
ncbi:MAG: ABC transporter ATP-binding protein [bacterium]